MCAAARGAASGEPSPRHLSRGRAFKIVAHAAPGVPDSFVGDVVCCGGTSVRVNLAYIEPDVEHAPRRKASPNGDDRSTLAYDS
jgi:hypothetical protein